jgi:hypothetical protein
MRADSVLLIQDGTNMAKLKKDNSGMKSAPMKKQTSDKNKVELKYRSTVMKNKKSFKPATESVTKGLPIGTNAVRTKDTLSLSDKKSKVLPLLKKNTLPLSDKKGRKLVLKKKGK